LERIELEENKRNKIIYRQLNSGYYHDQIIFQLYEMYPANPINLCKW